jgi:phage baseplate assembly protein W
MPLSQTVQTNPINLNKNIAIGIAIPFSAPSAFTSTYDFKTQIKYNLINLLLTNKGERIMNPEFGCNLKSVLFEGITEDTFDIIRNLINTNVGIFVPQVAISDIIIDDSPDYNNNNTISITIQYSIIISGNPDSITLQFT